MPEDKTKDGILSWDDIAAPPVEPPVRSKALFKEFQAAKRPKTDSTAPTGDQIPQKTSRPKELLRHDISDEELDMLAENHRENLGDAFWAFVGIAVGSFIPAAEAIILSFIVDETIPINFIDLLQVLMFFVGLCLAIALGIIAHRRGKRQIKLVDKIKKRGERTEGE